MRIDSYRTQERALMACTARDAFDHVIIDGKKILAKGPKNCVPARLCRWYEDVEWFFSDDRSYIYNFATICDVLDLPAEDIRGKLAYFMKNMKEYEENYNPFRGV